MSHAVLADWMAAILWLSILAFAVLGGADFGAGIWDLLAHGRTGEQQRGALIRAIGPIWEANEIWLIFLVTGTWTAFPLVFSSVMTALFVPLTIGLLGVVMRGAAFAFYTHFRAVRVAPLWGRAFSVASLAAPYLFGSVAAAVVSGHIRVPPAGVPVANPILTWVTPFAITTGCFAVAICAVLAATYMTVEAAREGMMQLTRLFRRRALIAGAVAAVLGAIDAFVARFEAPYLYAGLTTGSRALFVALAAVLLGLATAAVLVLGFYRFARILCAGMVSLILAAWSVAQLPYLIVPDVTIARAAAPSGVLTVMLLATIVTLLLVLPAQYYLLHLFKAQHRRQPPISVDEYIGQIALAQEIERQQSEAGTAGTVATRAGGKLGHWAAMGAATLTLVLLTSLGDTLLRRLSRRRGASDKR